MITKVPNYFDAKNAVKGGTDTPLDWFVYHNEPAGRQDESDFREQLTNVLEYQVGKQASLINQLACIIVDAAGDGYVTQNDLDVANDALTEVLPLLPDGEALDVGIERPAASNAAER